MIVHAPNLVAVLALLAWIPLAFVAFRFLRPAVACFLIVFCAEILLPVGAAFSFKGLPDMGRNRIAALAALAACLVLHPKRLRAIGGNPWILLFLAVLAGSSLATALTNTDLAVQGVIAMPAMSAYDALSLFVGQALDLAVPFVLGLALYRSQRDLRFLQRALVVAALAYTLPILFELRMSPQLHGMLYGYAPHAFIQHVRGSGYRPMVFMGHGLGVSMFLATAVLAAVGLWRARLPVWRGVPALPAAVYLMVVLVLSKSFAPVVYAIAGTAVLLLPGTRIRNAVSALLVSLVLLYPALRTLDWVPTDRMVESAAALSPDRANSLQFRFDNEGRMLERAHERIWFGWGTWGRNRVFDRDWGYDLTIVDGYWIVAVSSFGVIGFSIRFALAVIPVWLLAVGQARIRSRQSRTLLASLAVLLAFRAVDLIPNSDYTAMLLLYAGALAGLVTGLPKEESARRRAARRRRVVAEEEAAPPPDAAPQRV